jgi:hypothetical protein
MNHIFPAAVLLLANSFGLAGCGSSGVSTGAGGGSNPNPTSSFVFYASGIEGIDAGPNFYAVAGSVAIDTSTGSVIDGEEDYNDGVGLTATNITISGGTLTISSTTGQGALTLKTNDGSLGSNGTETFAVQFVNSKHALIAQFDGSATSSGSLDLQTLPSTLTGGFSFSFTGADNLGNALAIGGVFSASGTNISSGEFDFNDGGNVGTAQAFSGTISSADSFGRGSIAPAGGTGLPSKIIYYAIGPEAIRIIDMDTTDVLIGSAFGQGSGSFSASSVGTAVFGIGGNPLGFLYAAAGRFSTMPAASPATFTGVGDNDEQGTVISAARIAGTYSISANGYGGAAFTTPLGDISRLGIYMTDPKLNLNDPNNTTAGLGGAVIVDLDGSIPAGVGVLVPQTDSATASFAGNYAFGGQDFFSASSGAGEFDFVGQGSVASGALSGKGELNDPFGGFSTTTAADTGVSFSGTATADSVNPGRYTMNALDIQLSGGTPNDFTVVVYQAHGDQLFWINEDTSSLWFGPFEQQPSNPAFPSVQTARR